jgi:hypothetical protein
MRRLFREESAPSGYLGGVFCREQQRSWTPAALELLVVVVRCKMQAAGCSGSLVAWMGWYLFFFYRGINNYCGADIDN